MTDDLNPAERLLLLADELRGAATMARTFAADVYDRERAEHLLGLAGRLAALTEIADPDALIAGFIDDAWMRGSPMVGVSAFVRDADGRVLLCRRRDDATWCLPGGLLEIGESPTVGALRELWEEAGVTGEVARLLGVFDGPTWGSRSSVHLVIMTFEVDRLGGRGPRAGRGDERGGIFCGRGAARAAAPWSRPSGPGVVGARADRWHPSRCGVHGRAGCVDAADVPET